MSRGRLSLFLSVSRRLSASRIDIPTAAAKSSLIAIGVFFMDGYYLGGGMGIQMIQLNEIIRHRQADRTDIFDLFPLN